jgi:hypothetical protein
MSPKLVRYRVKPEKIEENQRLVEDVFLELAAKSWWVCAIWYSN